MSVVVKTNEELASALKNSEDTIEVEGDLKIAVIRIKATGLIAWAIAIAAIAAAVVLVIASLPTGGTSAVASLAVAPIAVGILGSSTTATCIGIAVAAGGVGVLNDLRDYDLIEKDGKVILKK